MKNYIEKEYIQLVKDRKENGLNMDLLICLLTRYSGDLCYNLETPSLGNLFRDYHQISIKDYKEEITKVYTEIKEKYGLTESFHHLEYLGGGKVDLIPDIAIGSGVICKILRYYQDIPYISIIFYSQGTSEIAKDIMMRYLDLEDKLIEKCKGQLKDLYEVNIVKVSPQGNYDMMTLPIEPIVSLTTPDFMDNYNQDFPEAKITEFLGMDKGGIMIFNGKPGCGKSTYLKSLILRNPKTRFILLPQNLLMNQETFRGFLFQMASSNRKNVYIVEDCEQLLVQRENNSAIFSSIIGDILNYTDGIFGDFTRTKFIFTFNTDLENIDKAILRPGRLFLKYEFTLLKGENLEKVAGRAGYSLSDKDKLEGLPISEIYHNSDIIIEGKPKTKRIGFTND